MRTEAANCVVTSLITDSPAVRADRTDSEKDILSRINSMVCGTCEDYMIYGSAGMLSVMKRMERIAETPATVLITGESGTGKEVAARKLHELSGVTGTFMAVNLGGLPESLIESELFGHEKGAFTDAHAMKKGLLETAENGTLFLDEIGEMSISLQVKMLRVLQDKKIRRVGGLTDIPVNARIIAATNRDLEKMVKEGSFREDLYYRLNVARLQLPPLRERTGDLAILTGHIIRKLNMRYGRNIENISLPVLRQLENHSFPGNIRELENILERGFIFSNGNIIETVEIDLPEADIISLPVNGTLKSMEMTAIHNSLKRWDGNRSRAAEELGVTRRTIFNKIKEYGLDSYFGTK